MKRIVGYVLVLIVLSGIAYAVYLFAPRVPTLRTGPAPEAATSTEVTVQEKVITESTDAYRIEAHYPQFGIPFVDEKVQAVIEKALTEFKSYPPNPRDSSTPQNELVSSYNSVYVGADVASVALSISEYTGGAHGNTVIIGVNVDRTTGEELTLDDALALIGKTLPQVADASLVQLKTTLGEDLAFPEGANATAENYGTFLVSYDRVTFVFNNYQVAPYAAGQQQVWFARKQ